MTWCFHLSDGMNEFCVGDPGGLPHFDVLILEAIHQWPNEPDDVQVNSWFNIIHRALYICTTVMPDRVARSARAVFQPVSPVEMDLIRV